MKSIAGANAAAGKATVFFACGNMVGDLPTRVLEAVSRGNAG
jgi:hypothetical protein